MKSIKFDDSVFTDKILEKCDLEKMQTKRLIHLVHCSTNSHYNKVTIKGVEGYFINYSWDNDNLIAYWYNEKELRDILKTRPHIPNKKERKVIIANLIAQNKRKTKRILKYEND